MRRDQYPYFDSIVTGVKHIVRIAAIIIFIFILFVGWKVSFPEKTDNATIQLSKVDFMELPCPEEVSLIIRTLKETDGVKSAHYYSESRSLLTSFDNRILSTAQIEGTIVDLSTTAVKAIKKTNYPQTGGCPIHKSKFLSYILNLFSFINLN